MHTFFNTKWGTLLLLMSGAMLTALTLVFPEVGFLQWVTMVPLYFGVYRLFEDPALKLGKSYLYGFFTVFCYYIVLYHWFVDLYPLDFIGMDKAASLVVVLAGWLGLTLLQALPGGLIFLFYRLIQKSGLLDRLPLLRPVLFSALWVIFEWSSTLGWTGVPWGRLALGQIKLLPMVQISSLLGSYAVSLLLLLVNGFLAYVLLYRTRQAICLGLAGGLLLGNLTFGLFSLYLPQKSGEKLTVAVLQGNINSHDKWDSDSTERTKEIYGEMTRAAAAEGAELIVWPETAFPYVLNQSRSLMDYVSELAEECGVTLIVGALRRDRLGEHEYNSLYLVTPEGEISQQYYDKRHLVPFGEYVPMREVIMTLIPPLAELSALGEDLTPGEDPALFDSAWGGLGSLICFDSIYETLSLDSVRAGAGLMLVSSNDSWFNDSAAVYQHQAQSQLRAVEVGRFYVRSANTGISTVISPKGELLRWLDPLTDGYAVCEAEVRTDRTLYSTVGNLLVWLCMTACVCLPVGYILKGRLGKAHSLSKGV